MNTSQEDIDSRNIDFAPWLTVPSDRIVRIEHPGIVRNIEKGIASLGGEKELAAFLHSTDHKKTAGLRITPEDGLRKPTPSWQAETSDMVLKISVPKRTGRRRKRGSDDPFCEYEDEGTNGAKGLLRSLRDNPDSCTVTPVGFVEETHRFRGLPDFQWSFAKSTLANSLRESILPLEYERLKDFDMDLRTNGNQPHMDMIPPPVFATSNIPFNYAYHQNPHVKVTHPPTTAAPILFNIYLAPPKARLIMPATCATVPLTAPPTLPDITTLDAPLQTLIATILTLLNTRPIISRRALLNHLPRTAEYDLKLALPYSGYAFSTGPWRDALVRFGYDPRTDREAHAYQTLVFKLEPLVPPSSSSTTIATGVQQGWTDSRSRYSRQTAARTSAFLSHDTSTHIFTGARLIPDGKVWQLADVTDALIAGILQQPDALRQTCDAVRDGWVSAGALAKVRVIMRDKIGLLAKGIQPDDADYARAVRWPNVITETSLAETVPGKDGSRWTAKEILLAGKWRSLVGRGAKGKVVARALNGGEEEEGVVQGGDEDSVVEQGAGDEEDDDVEDEDEYGDADADADADEQEDEGERVREDKIADGNEDDDDDDDDDDEDEDVEDDDGDDDEEADAMHT